MLPTVKELKEKRKPLVNRIVALRDAIYKDDKGAALDKPRAFNTEEQAEWDRVNTEEQELTRQIQINQRAEELAREMQTADTSVLNPRGFDYDGKKAKKDLTAEERTLRKTLKNNFRKQGWNAAHVTEEMRADVLQGWARGVISKRPKPKHVESARKMGLSPRVFSSRDLSLNLLPNRGLRGVIQRHASAFAGLTAEQRAQFLNANVAGGYLVPEGFVQNLEIALLAYANVRLYADVLRTASGQDLPWPTVNDTTNKGARLQENATVGELDMTFGQTILHAYKYTSKLVQVPVELMEDSAFDLAAVLGELLGIRIGRIQADEFTTGTGNSMPTGFVIGATSGVTAASSTAIAADDLYGLEHSIDPAYRDMPGVGWVFNDQILLAIKKLKDGVGRYLWKDGLAGIGGGYPATIDDKPYFINQSMASTITSGNKTVVFGALKKIKIRDVSQIRLRRLVERYADQDLEGFVMFMRSDCQLLDAGTHPIKYLVH